VTITPPAKSDALGSVTMPALEARNVTFGYAPGRPVLDGWSATFPGGSMTALTGPSGRGKSTLLYLLGLMLRPQSGEILVDGLTCGRLSDAGRARLRAVDGLARLGSGASVADAAAAVGYASPSAFTAMRRCIRAPASDLPWRAGSSRATTV